MRIPAVTAALILPAAIRLHPPAIVSVTFRPDQVAGAASTTGTVTLNAVWLVGPVDVALASGNASLVNVPSTVRVPAGSRSASIPVTAVWGPGGCAAVSATAGRSRAIALMHVEPAPIPASGLTNGTVSLTTPAIIVAGQSNGGRGGYSPSDPLQTSVTINLSSSNPSVASVPASVWIDLRLTKEQVSLNPPPPEDNFTIRTFAVAEPTCAIIRAGNQQNLVRITRSVLRA